MTPVNSISPQDICKQLKASFKETIGTGDYTATARIAKNQIPMLAKNPTALDVESFLSLIKTINLFYFSFYIDNLENQAKAIALLNNAIQNPVYLKNEQIAASLNTVFVSNQTMLNFIKKHLNATTGSTDACETLPENTTNTDKSVIIENLFRKMNLQNCETRENSQLQEYYNQWHQVTVHFFTDNQALLNQQNKLITLFLNTQPKPPRAKRLRRASASPQAARP